MKRHDAVRGRRNGWVAATLTAVASAALVFFAMREGPPCPAEPPPDFDSVVRIPDDAPIEDPEEEGGMPSRGQFKMAQIDAWVLTHDIFADLKSGKITREKAIGGLRQLAKRVKEGDVGLFDAAGSDIASSYSYTQTGEDMVLELLLNSAVSNLLVGVEK